MGWGQTPNSVGIQISYYLAYNAAWQQAGITAVPTTITATAVSLDVEPTVNESVSAYPIIDAVGFSGHVMVEDVPAGTYRVTYVITAEPIVVNGVTYQAASSSASYTVEVPEVA